jgi:hypothetical protein
MVADLANSKLRTKQSSSPRRLDILYETAIAKEEDILATLDRPESLPLPLHALRNQPSKLISIKSWDVYVDDFIGMVQGNPGHLQHVKNIFLTSLDKVLRKLDNQENVHRQEPASVKHMLKGDATWATRKVVLGWLLDTCAMAVQLPPH